MNVLGVYRGQMPPEGVYKLRPIKKPEFKTPTERINQRQCL